MNKKACFIFGLPARTNPALITMPFGLNVIKLLKKENYIIDVFLSEYKNNNYQNLEDETCSINFFDSNLLWRNQITLSYYLLIIFFWIKSIFSINKYDLIFASGQVGIVFGSIMKKFNKNAKLIYLNDEFPDSSPFTIWVNAEKNHAIHSDIVVVPDEHRFKPLCDQIKGLNEKKYFTLPNGPLKEDLIKIHDINWHEYFNLNKEYKLLLTAGAIDYKTMIDEILNSVKHWPENTILIIKDKGNGKNISDKIKKLGIENKVIWTNEIYSPEKLHSLIKYCTASFCLYNPIDDNMKYVGKSAGKLMRSIALGTPVITTNLNSLNFVRQYNLGVIIEDIGEISSAVKAVINDKSLSQNCIDNFEKKMSFESYWFKLKTNFS